MQSRTETTAPPAGDTAARKTFPWFNPHRESRSPPLTALIEQLYRIVDGYEFAVLRRKRARTAAERENLYLLVESFVSDLVYRHGTQPDDPLLVIRSNKVLTKRSRYRPSYYSKKFRLVLDALAHQPENAQQPMAYIKQELGSPDMGFKKGTTTMIRTTERLRTEITSRGLDVHSTGTRPGEEVIILRDATLSARDGEYGALVEYPDTEETRRIRAEIKTINDYLADADITAVEEDLPNTCDPNRRRMRRIFTYGSFRTGGRLYDGFWQSLPRAIRAEALQLQGESVVTLDYGQMALRLAYSTVSVEPSEGDGYQIPGLENYRGPIKKLVNSMLFERHEHWALIPRRIRNRLPEHLSDAEIVEMIQRKHPALIGLWWTNIGHHLQKTESDIIVTCLLKCIERDITALQVHDALIVPASREVAVREIMTETFGEVTGLPVQVTTE